MSAIAIATSSNDAEADDPDYRPPTPKREIDPLSALMAPKADACVFVCVASNQGWPDAIGASGPLFAVVDVVDALDSPETPFEREARQRWAVVRLRAGAPIVLASDPAKCNDETLIRHTLQRHFDTYHKCAALPPVDTFAAVDVGVSVPSPLRNGFVLVTAVASRDGPLIVPYQFHDTETKAEAALKLMAKRADSMHEFDIKAVPAATAWDPSDVARCSAQQRFFVNKIDEVICAMLE